MHHQLSFPERLLSAFRDYIRLICLKVLDRLISFGFHLKIEFILIIDNYHLSTRDKFPKKHKVLRRMFV